MSTLVWVSCWESGD